MNGSRKSRAGMAFLLFLMAACVHAVDYDVAYVRQPRAGDDTHLIWPEAFHPARVEPGCDLVLLHPDGQEEVLVQGGVGAVTDPMVSFDGEWIYYAYFYDVRPENLNYQRGYLSYDGSDIFRIHVETRDVEQLTFGEFTPNTGAGNWDESNPVNPSSQYDRLGYGILNLGPCPVAGGRVAFVSNRNGFVPPRSFTGPTLQLFVMDEDGENVTPIAPMTIGSSLHPTPLADGRIMFSSYESQGLRDQRNWGIWAIWPDGRVWEPIVSSFKGASVFHFMTELSSGDVVVEDYYNLNNFGFGALYRFPIEPPAGEPRFHSAFLEENPSIDQTIGQGFSYPFRMPFTPKGMHSIVPFTHGNDEAAPEGVGGRVGKFTHPSAAPGGDMLVAWSGGPVNALNRPTDLPAPDAGIYLMPGGGPISSPSELELLKNDANYNEVWPRAVVPYADIHGVAEPHEFDWLPNDGSEHDELPAGTPYGLVGTSSLYKRESFPGWVVTWSDFFDGLDAFNTSENEQSPNWMWQGAEAGKYKNKDIWAVRLVALEPNSHHSYGPHEGRHFYNFANEKMRILGEIPVRKFKQNGKPVRDPEGNPDTSFLAKIPADTPFTFQTLDRNGMVLNMAQTWHQVRPGEVRNNCGGCHAHSQQPLAFEQTAAARPNYAVWDLVTKTPLLSRDGDGNPIVKTKNKGLVNVEFYADIRPILKKHCVQCHTKKDSTPPGNLVLDDRANYGGVPGDYARLADDQDARWGHPPLVTVGGDPVWRQTNASRYVRMFQSRRSLLVWKVFGKRLDGWKNTDHPTETTPGDPGTLQGGANINAADLDYTGSIMPPPGSGVPPLSEDQKMTIARWIDLGCPIDLAKGTDDAGYGWLLDDLRPTLDVSLPRPGANAGPVGTIRIGVADANSGIQNGSLSVKSDIAVAGRSAGAELADLAQSAGGGIYTIAVSPPLNNATKAHLYVEVKDNQGNVTRVNRAFYVGE